MKKFLPQTLGGPHDNFWNKFLYWHLGRGKQLLFLIRKVHPRRIMEIGVYQGESAEKAIKAAESVGVKNIEYYGFDLFEKPPDYEVKFLREGFLSLEKVKARLQKTGAEIFLCKGNMRESLPREIRNLPKMDFIYIDGGHSYETVKSDWKNAQKLMHTQTLVVFDDYDNFEGVTKAVDEIKGYHVKILSSPLSHEKGKHVLVFRVSRSPISNLKSKTS